VGRSLWDRGIALCIEHYGIVASDSGIAQWVEYYGIVG